ncbi:MAG: hypothetical protein IKF64_03250 [Eubacterium sp.]|nr:hypothetical protein [Eubacterium sp.]
MKTQRVKTKTAASIFLCILVLLLLCGCNAKEQNNMEAINGKTLTIINEVNDANIWILPRTQENLKTTLWGTATASDVKTGESRQAPLCDAGDDGLYIFRMIDTDKFYYSADSLVLEDGCTMRIKEKDIMTYELEVSDKNGEIKNTYEVFCARL